MKIQDVKENRGHQTLKTLSRISTVAFVHARKSAFKKITYFGTLRSTFKCVDKTLSYFYFLVFFLEVYVLRAFYARCNRKSAS